MLKDNLNGQYCLVSGILIRDENLSKVDIQKNYLKKRLGVDPKSREVVISAKAYSWFYGQYWPSNEFFNK